MTGTGLGGRKTIGAVLVGFVALAGCSGGSKPRVLDASLSRPAETTTTTTGAFGVASVEPSTTTSVVTTTRRDPVASTKPPTTTAPVPAATTTESPATTAAGESMAPGTYVEGTDQANEYYVAPDGTTQASAIQTTRRDAPERADVTVMYYGTSVEVQLTNLADRTVLLPDGYGATVECRRDGQVWRSTRAADTATTSVERGATVSATVDVPADGPGSYTCSATVTIVLP